MPGRTKKRLDIKPPVALAFYTPEGYEAIPAPYIMPAPTRGPRRVDAQMESVVTFHCPRRGKGENERYAGVRRKFMAIALKERTFDLYEMLALGLSGTDIGECVDSFMLVDAIASNDSRFIATALDNLMDSEKTSGTHERACRALNASAGKSRGSKFPVGEEIKDRIRRWDV